MITQQENQSLVIDFNDSAAEYPSSRTIVDLFDEQAARTPSAEAIRFDGQTLTYAELQARANQTAALLRSTGAGPGQLIVVFMEHSIEVVCAIFGILKSGAAYVPVDPSSPRERVAFMLDDIAQGSDGAPLIITQSRLVERLPAVQRQVVTLDADFFAVADHPITNVTPAVTPDDLAYVIYTSGSTGKPKGVMIEHRSLVNYIWWANAQYCGGESLTFPLFSSLAFDLTVTSIFTPLISGGRIVVYAEDREMPGMVVLDVVSDGVADIVKLTPAHLAMVRDANLAATHIRKLILGGEDLKTGLAREVTTRFGRPVEIYNEYGPTEATVGCMIHRFDPSQDRAASVPIGTPAANSAVYVLDEHLRPVPKGVVGEMYLAGHGLARGYFRRPELTSERFVVAESPVDGSPMRLYRTGDLARWTANGRMEFLGRADDQVKIGAARIELGEIEATLLQHSSIRECVAGVVTPAVTSSSREVQHCLRCGLASTLPGTTFDAEGICNLCRAYESYADKAEAYFRTPEELRALVAKMKAERKGDYDCMIMLSGGKDSTYMLYQLCALGLKPLVFTLDNGFLSDQAKANIRRVVEALGVDHVFGTTPHMNEIFVDSLNRFANVCNGCFKTIYTLSTGIALEKGIRYIITGLSRGQFFETRLTEEVFKREDFHVDKLDALVLEARKEYHRRPDAVSCYLEVDVFSGDGIYEQIEFVDFYRYWSAPLTEMYAFLDAHAPWVRPSDTGRSTNCLINDVGIYVHKKQRGYHNYALPYSWDVRLGQKNREQAMAELDDDIDETRVRQLMDELGYAEPQEDEETAVERLAVWYVSDRPLTADELRAHLSTHLPDYMMPAYFVRMERLPLTPNGKVDRQALTVDPEAEESAREIVQPRTTTEKTLADIWMQLLNVRHLGVDDDFFDLGAQSLLAIRAVSRIREAFGVDVALRNLFERPTVAGLAEVIDGLSWVATDRAPSPAGSGREEITL
ncbi:MAG TPA: amino acid adenylation domain-containing protein [Thermoanaerobaculia bacterium]|nr:amino acid adenylation domain-containing protein [Thermoanaerobaculia bacterium]